MSLLALHGVRKRFGARVALDGVSLDLDRGQMLGLYGPTGAGKSTLLRVAAGLMAPEEGQVLYDGQPLGAMPASERQRLRRREISCVWSGGESQERLGVLDHVSVALLIDGRDHRRAARAARAALEACEVAGCAGMELRELSDGQRKRVEIARAIVTEPRLLLADGPASTLSMIEQEKVMALLGRMARQARVGVLVADSDAAALIGAEEILYLNDGRLIGQERGGEGNVVELPPRARAADA